ncbi:hypothetical protein JCM3774_000033 [Rhodotorula dairenensis]
MATNSPSSALNNNNNNNNNNRGASRGPLPASAAPGRIAAPAAGGQTPGGLFAHAGQRAQTSPRRTPRAALSVSSAAPVAPGGERRPHAGAPLTPALTNAQLRAHQLVRTPASRRRERVAASIPAGGNTPAGTAATKSRWRASLAGAPGPEAAAKLAERHDVVRVTASDALEELLEVGLDAAGAENGNYTISETTQSLVTVFQGSKSKYLSDAPFLETRTLAHVLPQEANDPSSRLNALVRICNLTTFMHLVLSAAPDPETGASSREGLAKLRQAADAMLRHVKPPQDPITDATLKLLVDLKCQMYIAAASLARGHVDATPYFSAPLSSHLSHAASIAMTDRSATVKFATMQSHALNTINETGGDWVVLRTKWTWSATIADTRNWVEGVVLASGLGVGTSLAADLEQDAVHEDSPVSGEAELAPESDPFAIQAPSFPTALNFERAAVEPESVAASDPGALGDEDVELVVVEQAEYVEIVQVPEAVEDDGSKADVQLATSNEGSTSGRSIDVKVAAHTETVEEQSRSSPDQGDESALSDESSGDEAAEAARVESLLQLLPEENLDNTTGLGGLTDEPLSLGMLEGELFQLLGDDGGHETVVADAPRSAASTAAAKAPAPGTLRFGPTNQLYRDAAPKPKSAFFEDRGRGEKIQFDSQSVSADDDQPVAGPSGTRHGLLRRSPSAEVPSPERPRGQGQRSPSPLPSRRVLEEDEDDDEAVARPAPAFGGQHGAHSFEADQYADDFGGGFDEAGAVEAEDDFADDHANRASGRPVSVSKARRRETVPNTRATDASQQPSSQVKRAQALAGGLRQAPTATGKANAGRRSDPSSSSSDFDSSSSSDSDSGVGNKRQRHRSTSHWERASPNRKRRRADHSILSSDEEPPRSGDRQSNRKRNDIPPGHEGLGNLYFQARNQPGGRIGWTPAEISELHKHLKAFGCDWKKMMLLSGPNGSKNQVFKHRNNVSLKDKAVNEKLALLRAGLPVPDYLDCVTVPVSKLPKVPPQLRAIETDESD